MRLHEAMRYASARRAAEGWPRCYYWESVWWRLSARESKNPREQLGSSRNMMRLYQDIQQRPEHYQSLNRPHGISDWQWSGLESAHSAPQAAQGGE